MRYGRNTTLVAFILLTGCATTNSVEVPIVNDGTYYTYKQVDIHPKALAQIEPQFPEKASNENVSGEVSLLLLIDETGKVRDLAVVDAKPVGYFDESALDAFRNSLWSPAQKDGRVVKSRVLIRVKYTPKINGVKEDEHHSSQPVKPRFKYNCKNNSEIKLKVFHSMYRTKESAQIAYSEILSHKKEDYLLQLMAAAKRDTIDEATRHSGGNLGYIKFGELDKDFEKAIFNMPPKTLSAPIRTVYGWHIVWVDETLDTRTEIPCL